MSTRLSICQTPTHAIITTQIHPNNGPTMEGLWSNLLPSADNHQEIDSCIKFQSFPVQASSHGRTMISIQATIGQRPVEWNGAAYPCSPRHMAKSLTKLGSCHGLRMRWSQFELGSCLLLFHPTGPRGLLRRLEMGRLIRKLDRCWLDWWTWGEFGIFSRYDEYLWRWKFFSSEHTIGASWKLEHQLFWTRLPGPGA